MNKALELRAIQTRLFKINENLFDFCLEVFQKEKLNAASLNSKILVITSKLFSLAEGKVVNKEGLSKEALVRSECDAYLGKIAHDCTLTIKHGLLLAAAGIDESNSENNQYILYPEDPFKSAQKLLKQLKDHFQIENLGILVTDSKTTPLRAGVTGVALAHAGFRAIENKVGDKDLFGRALKMTVVNVADALASAACYCMGESSECCPLALIHAPVQFIREEEENPQETKISPELDLYYPLYKDRL
jgi:F420-0:gamma-glutamyl ligase